MNHFAAAGTPPTESGFTIVEVVMSIAVLAMVSASLAGAFWAAIRTETQDVEIRNRLPGNVGCG